MVVMVMVPTVPAAGMARRPLHAPGPIFPPLRLRLAHAAAAAAAAAAVGPAEPTGTTTITITAAVAGGDCGVGAIRRVGAGAAGGGCVHARRLLDGLL
jgi:hypothetical protein